MIEDRTRVAQETEHLLRRFDKKRESLIPILQGIQGHFGYVPREAMLKVAGFLNMPEVDVYSVVTFYNQFRRNPPGKHSVRVCLGTACHVKGGYTILDAWKRRLHIDQGQTTPDREFDLDTVACVGCCAMAPVTVVDSEVKGKVTPTRVDGILLSFQLEKKKRREEQQ